MLAILVMGFASGLPLALTGATLAVWMRQDGLSLTAIGLFALVGLAYNVKFLWAPLLDQVRLPWLGSRMGRRRSWTLFVQAALFAAILVLAGSDPAGAPLATAIAAVTVAFLSASQDVVIDAFRVELLDEREQGAGAAATQVGYRLGMVASGAGALYLAEFFGWAVAYSGMALLLLPAMAVVWATPEPSVSPGRAGAQAPAQWLRAAFLDPLVDLARRAHWVPILVFILLPALTGGTGIGHGLILTRIERRDGGRRAPHGARAGPDQRRRRPRAPLGDPSRRAVVWRGPSGAWSGCESPPRAMPRHGAGPKRMRCLTLPRTASPER